MEKKKQSVGQGFTHNLWILMLRKGIKGFAELPFSDQFHLSELILISDKKRRRHHRYEDSGGFAIPYQDLNRRFRRGRFKAINERLNIFLTSGNWYSDRGEGRCYWLTHKAAAIKKKYERYRGKDKVEQSRFIYESGRYMRTPKQAIAAKNNRGNTAKNETKEGQIQSLTPLNIENLENYAKALKKDIARVKGKLYNLELFVPDNPQYAIQKGNEMLAYVRKVIMWVNTDIGKNMYLLHNYVEHSTGRLYAVGAVNLQNSPRVIRQAALQGFYDYDFENCHYSLFKQLTERVGGKAESIDYYLENKNKIRQGIADDIGQEKKLVKQCLLAIIYGAQASEYWLSAIHRYLGKEGARRFNQHPFVVALREDLEANRETIIKSYKVSNKGKITNAMGCTIEADKDPKKILAHILQGLEAKLLEVARLMHHDKIILLQHDGFTSTEKLDCRAIERQIEKATGYTMEVSEELLQIPSNLLPEEQVKPNRETDYSFLESTIYEVISTTTAS